MYIYAAPEKYFAAVYSLRLRMMLTDSVTNHDIYTYYIYVIRRYTINVFRRYLIIVHLYT